MYIATEMLLNHASHIFWKSLKDARDYIFQIYYFLVSYKRILSSALHLHKDFKSNYFILFSHLVFSFFHDKETVFCS